MATKHIWLLIAALLAVSVATFADVPPDTGYKRISLNLIIESETEFPDYRFFMKSGADLKEITLNKGEIITIEPLGGGAYYRAGTLLAVPKKGLEGLSGTTGDGKFSELEKAVYDGKAAGALQLVNHSFTRDVSILEAPGWKDPVYRIEQDPHVGLKAVHLSGGANESKIDNAAGSGLAFWRSAAAAIVAGIFLAFGLVIIGVWYFRKSSKAV